MPSTYSPNLRIELQAIGENRSTWGTKANTDYSLLEQAITGFANIPIVDANTTLTAVNGATDQARNAILTFTGTLTAARTVTIPTVPKIYIVKNSTAGGFAVNLKTSIGTTFTLASGATTTIYCDGTNISLATDLATQASLSVDNKVVYSSKGGNYTAVANDNNGYIRFTAAATLSLTAVATLGVNWHVYVYAAGGDVVVDPAGSELINDVATITIGKGAGVYIICDGLGFRTDFSLHDYTAKTSAVGADEVTVWDSATGIVRKMTALNFWTSGKWAAQPIGAIYMVDTSITGIDIPPSSTTDTVWIELTAGLTGAGKFNNGKLTSESVTGSAPLVLASAVISVSGSPMNGQPVRLLNTEGRILRPNSSPGTLQDDALQNITGTAVASRLTRGDSTFATTGAFYHAGVGSSGIDPGSVLNSSAMLGIDASLVARTATETRMKNVGVKAYMRVK